MSPLRRSLRVLGPALLAFAAAWALVALCLGGSSARNRALVVEVREDSGEPLAEVPIHASGRPLGVTDATGSLRRPLAAPVSVVARCPEAYRQARAQIVSKSSTDSQLTFVCRPRLRTIAVVVHAPFARGLTLRADEQSLGRVDEQGLLHAVVRRAPGTQLSLLLAERGAQPLARRTVPIEDRDQVVLFEP
jgi:hypothetical protein